MRKGKEMGYVTTWIGEHEIEVLDSSVIECMEFFQCSYDDALFSVALHSLDISAADKVKLIRGE